MSLIQLTSENFEQEVKNSTEPVLVDFYADWCGPCKMMSPVMEELSSEFEGKCKVAKLNVDNASSIAAEFGVMSIPTLILFKEGNVVSTITGAVPKEKLVELVNNNI